jgi:tRNA(fMet)-specific endonuclease VapC
MIILDSTILIDLFQGNDVARRFMDYITNFFPEDGVATTAVNYYEVYTGINHRRSKKEELFFREFFSNINILDLDQKAAEEASRIMARLLSDGRPIKSLDVLIAGIAKANGATKLVARDRHFECISDVVDFEILVYKSQSK